MAAGRIRPRDPRHVADHLFRALIGHFVADGIAHPKRAPRADADPFVAHLVDTIATYLERRSHPASVGRRRPKGRRAP